MPEFKPIRIPLSHRWRRFRLRWLPQLVFVTSILAIGLLWRQHGEFANGVGEIEAVRVEVAASADGQLMSLSQMPFTIFDNVLQNQLIARMDDRLLNAELRTLSNELDGLHKQIAATQTQHEFDQADFGLEQQREAMRLAWQIEQLRLDGLDRDVQLAMDEVEIQRLEARLDVLKPLIKGGYSSELEAIDARALRDAALARVKSSRVARAEVAEQFALANDRIQSLETIDQPEVQSVVESMLGPVRASLATQQSKIDELKLQLMQLEIRSPIAGTITEIHAWPGQVVQKGQPILTVAAQQGRFIVGYLREDQSLAVKVGEVVSVHDRGRERKKFDAIIDRVGPQVQQIPEHQLSDRSIAQWGVPLRIALPAGLTARPGELVDLRFRRVVE